MSNMSYCRFRNTVHDLLDCQQALRDIEAGDGETLSRDEREAANRLLRLCREIAEFDDAALDGGIY